MDWLKDRLGLRHCLQDIVAIERQDSLKSLRVRLETNGALLRREGISPSLLKSLSSPTSPAANPKKLRSVRPIPGGNDRLHNDVVVLTDPTPGTRMHAKRRHCSHNYGAEIGSDARSGRPFHREADRLRRRRSPLRAPHTAAAAAFSINGRSRIRKVGWLAQGKVSINVSCCRRLERRGILRWRSRLGIRMGA